MNASYHPGDDLLMSYAAGSMDEPSSILIATHLALCPSCRRHVKEAESVGGALLEDVDLKDNQSGALNSVLARLDNVENEDSTYSPPMEAVDDHLNLPRPLKDYVGGSVKALPWRWLGPGVHYTPIAPHTKGPKVGLLRIAPGTRVPMHGHSGNELIMVLSGGYTDETGNFLRGDVETADDGLVHQPVAHAGEECMCLVVTEGALQPTGMIAKLAQKFFRF